MPKYQGRYRRHRKKSKTYTSSEPLRHSVRIASMGSVVSEEKEQEIPDQAQDNVISVDEKGTPNKCTVLSKYFAA